MSADPDFHPLAAAWLDGAATPPEQQLLREILHDPDKIPEFAALCRTEAMLAQCGRSTPTRRAALKALLTGKTRSQQFATLWRHHGLRWAAAAAVVALAAWALWPNPDKDKEQAMRKNSFRLVAPVPDSSVGPIQRETPLPPAAEGLETLLRRYHLAAFSASGPLPDAVSQLAAAVKLTQNPPLAADVRTSGDAPVHLQLSSALPAWTILQMMALQTGTEFRLSGHQLVFLPAARPVPAGGSMSKTADYASLRLFLGMPKATDPAEFPENSENMNKDKDGDGEDEEEDPADALPVQPRENPADMPVILSAITSAALGPPLSFTLPEKDSVKYTGSPRAARLLELALSVPARAAMEVECKLLILAAPKDLVTDAARDVTGDPNVEIFRLTLSNEQQQHLMRKLSMTRGVDIMTMPIARGPTNERLEAAVKGKVHKNGVFAEFSGLVSSQDALSLSYSITVANWDEQAQSVLSEQDVGKVSTTSGRTIVVPGHQDVDGRELTYLITGTVFKNDGITPEVILEPPPAPEELPYGIPVADKPGMVQSPYASDKGQIDVTGFKRGTRVECPYTGKHFRVP